jgi:hypothetical protein
MHLNNSLFVDANLHIMCMNLLLHFPEGLATRGELTQRRQLQWKGRGSSLDGEAMNCSLVVHKGSNHDIPQQCQHITFGRWVLQHMLWFRPDWTPAWVAVELQRRHQPCLRNEAPWSGDFSTDVALLTCFHVHCFRLLVLCSSDCRAWLKISGSCNSPLPLIEGKLLVYLQIMKRILRESRLKSACHSAENPRGIYLF